MASSVIGALRVVLGLDSAQFESGLQRANRANKNFANSTMGVSSAVRGMAAALGIVSVGATARGFLSLADQSKQLTAQLKLATNASGSFAQAQADVRRIAGETRTGLAETAHLYATFQRNSRELGITQEESARATETITKAFKISGATAAEAAGGLRQFLQGIQSGTLRGEELNSVLENAPRLARALADGLGVTIGQLRAMGQEGELTGRAVLDALAGAAVEIDREFTEMPKTFDEAMTTLHNAALITFGGFDSGGQFSTALANFITQGTDGFADLERGAQELGIDVRSTMAGLHDVFEPLLAGAKSAFGEIGDEAKTLHDRIRPIFGEIDAITAWAGRTGLNRAGMFVSNPILAAQMPKYNKGTDLQGAFDRAQQASETRLRRANRLTPASKALGRLSEANNRARQGDAPAPAASSSKPSSKGKGGGRKGPSEETLRNRAQRDLERAETNLRRFMDDVALSQADLASSAAELSRDLQQRADVEKGQIEADRARRERAIKADDDLDDAKRQQLLSLNEQEAASRKALVDQRLRDDLTREAARITQDRADLEIEFLNYSRDLARTANERRDVELRILDLAFEAERARLESIKATHAVTSAEYKYAAARLAALPALKGFATRQAQERTQGPLESYLSRLPRTADEVNEALEGVATGGIQSIVDGLAEAATGARSLGSVFKNVARDIIADLIRIQIRKAIVSGLSSILNIGGAPALGKAAPGTLEANFDAAFGISGRRANGGPVMAGKAYLVGERGPEVVVPRFGGMVIPNRDLSSSFAADFKANDNGGGSTVTVVPSPLFDVHVDGRAARVAAPMAMASGHHAERSAVSNISRRARRRIPG